MKQLAPHVAAWVERMNTTPDIIVDTPDTDSVPETLVPILKRIFHEFLPVLRDTVAILEEWKHANGPDKPIPRGIGNHSFQIGNVKGERTALSFQQWKLQRVLDVYQGFDANEKQQVNEWLHNVVGVDNSKDVFEFKIRERVTRKDNKLVWENDTQQLQARL